MNETLLSNYITCHISFRITVAHILKIVSYKMHVTEKTLDLTQCLHEAIITISTVLSLKIIIIILCWHIIYYMTKYIISLKYNFQNINAILFVFQKSQGFTHTHM